MILLDTHVWIWWVHGDRRLGRKAMDLLESHEEGGLGVSVISCWEIAKLVEHDRLELHAPVLEWLQEALGYPGVALLPLTPEIVVDSSELPGGFHKDPADQLIVATARVEGIHLATADRKLLRYPEVETLDMRSRA